MNLNTIFKNHTWIAIILSGYFVLFIFLNVKHGIVATPVMQYGMFSSMQNSTDTQSVYEYYLNKEKILLNNYSFTERDILLTSLHDYLNHRDNNKAVFSSFNNVIQKVKINVTESEQLFYNHTNDTIFTNWYKDKLAAITNKKIKLLDIYIQKYIWKGDEFLKVDTAQKIKEIVN